MADLSTRLGDIKLKNPTILASGFLGVDKATIKMVADKGAGAVTIKSITKEPREGHKNPIVVEYEHGLLNAVGYSNMGLKNALDEFSNLGDIDCPVIASIVADNAEGFAELAQSLGGLEFSAIEAVLSCPHTPGLGLLAGHGTPEATYEITKAVREKTRKPLILKLSPNVPELGEIAKSAVKAGANIINMGNTVGPGMVIDTETGKPVLMFKVGGVSGPAIRPIAVRCVYDVYESVKVPIIGTGGIVTGRDAIEMVMAGASAIGIGTGILYRDLDIFSLICKEISEYMNEHRYGSVNEIVGIAHEK